MATTAPYGEWISPIGAAQLTVGAHPVAGGRYVGDDIWWLEQRPDQGGRYAVRRTGDLDVLPAPWNARTRVHEYGGGSWTATDDGVLLFTEFNDQRIYRLDPGADTPVAISPSPEVPAGLRYAQLAVRGTDVVAVREAHAPDGTITRDVVAVPLSGAAVADPAAVRTLGGGSHFLAHPRWSPDGTQLSWIAWEHPQMPWDGTELRVDGRTIIGSTTESVLQPEWLDEQTLVFASDRSGWWNLYSIGTDGGEPAPLYPAEEEFAGPLWTLGSSWFALLPGGDVLTVHGRGTQSLGILSGGELRDLELPGLTGFQLCDVRDGRALVLAHGARTVAGLREIDLATAAVTDVRLSTDELPEEAYLPAGQDMTFTGDAGREVHAIVYPPTNPDFVAPDGELPPYIAFVHGGPTSQAVPTVDLVKAYFTSRGLGVVDVNYGGSTGYGREYRDRLRGQWGIVDVQDTVAAVLGLADAGLADRDRLAIEGGSAGGWTVLASLTGTDVFACGASYFGVAELIQFAQETHDFESRYLDGLIGSLPEDEALYVERAPLNQVDRLSCPVLLLQGLDDPIVPPAQAERFRDALRDKGLRYAYLAYEGESHGFRRAETIIDSRQSELSFYGQVLGFDPPGLPVLALEN